MLKLLVIDDDELTAKTLQGMAVACGTEAKYVCDHTLFFDVIESFEPDVIALDLKMPEFDGIEVLKGLARRNINSHVFITSGTGAPILASARRVAENLGINMLGVLSKPFSIEQLQEKLTSLHTKKIVSDVKSSSKSDENQLSEDSFVADLRAAIKHDQIEVYFQPKIRCDSGTLDGFEALARWQHPEKGFVNPEVFVGLCEIHGLIDLFTTQIVNKSIQWLSSLSRDQGSEKALPCELRWAKLSLNISAQSLANEILFSNIIQTCQTENIQPNRIILEITESGAMDDSGPALENLIRLRLMGFELSIDDFGTGYSSMTQLVKAPFSEIKIDKSFVLKIDGDDQSQAITRSISELGRSLGSQVTAEGVESENAMRYLKQIKCDIAQGYHIGKPMPPCKIIEWFYSREKLREQNRLSALKALSILDTPSESRFDRLTRLARRLFNVPIALVSLIDDDRQWFKSVDGLDIKETPRDIAFCNSAIQQDGIFVVEDAIKDPEFKNNPLVKNDPKIRFYAGKPLLTDSGHKLGTLCIIDKKPRKLSYSEKKLFSELVEFVKEQINSNRNDILDERSGILPRGTYNQQARKVVNISRQLSLNITAISVRLMNIGAIEREYGEDKAEKLLRELNQLFVQFVEVTDLIGRHTYCEVVALVIAPGSNEDRDVCQKIHKSVVTWIAGKQEQNLILDCEIGMSKIPCNDQRPYDQVLEEQWQLYAAVISE